MLIGFIGCPASGKTTTAARLFAHFKDVGLATEFIPEQARWHIAEERLNQGLPPGSQVELDDIDQTEIYYTQLSWENILRTSTPKSLIITDSCVLNTLMYLKGQEGLRKVMLSNEVLKRYDLLFYCPPTSGFGVPDPNRIHDHEQGLAIDKMLTDSFEEFGISPLMLTGNTQTRYQQALGKLLEHLSAH
jgi:nicotinamide riboside kinase